MHKGALTMSHRRYERSQSDRANAVAAARARSEPFPNNVSADAPTAAWGRGADLMERGREEMHNLENTVVRHPVVAVVAGFGVGFGLGVLATLVMCGERRSSSNWLSRHPLSGSVTDSWNQMSSGLKRVPGMIADHLPSGFGSR
jgi:hypothetical protein